MTRKRRIDTALIVAEAIQIANAQGLDKVTLAAVASVLEVRIPSLYNHINGLDDLHYRMGVWLVQSLGDVMRDAAVGQAGEDALRSIAYAYRAFVHQNPGLYHLLLRAPTAEQTELETAGESIIQLLGTVLRPYQLTKEHLLHAIRLWRSMLHGFADIEVSGGFGLPLDIDETFRYLIDGLVVNITRFSVEDE